MNNHIARCTIVLAILMGLALPAHAQRRPITEKDLSRSCGSPIRRSPPTARRSPSCA